MPRFTLVSVRGWFFAMVTPHCAKAQYSLDAVDFGDEMLVTVQVECGRKEVNDGEKQEKDKHKETDNERSSTHHG